jgi:hypothetical protein
LRLGELLIDVGELVAGRGHPHRDRAFAGEKAEELLLELDPALLGLLQILLAAAQLLVEEGQALACLVAVSGEVLLDEQVEKVLYDRGGELGVLRIGEARRRWRWR